MSTDKDAYIKRMEDAVIKANVAMTKLRQENSQLKGQIATLEAKVASLETQSRREFANPSFMSKIAPRMTTKIARAADEVHENIPTKRPRTNEKNHSIITKTATRSLPAVKPTLSKVQTIPYIPPLARPPLSQRIEATTSPSTAACAEQPEDEISAAIDAAFDDISSHNSDSNSDDECNSDHDNDIEEMAISTSDPATVAELNPESPPLRAATHPSAMPGWKKITIKTDKQKGVHVQSVVEQLDADTVHSVTNALVGTPNTAVVNALYRQIENFARENSFLWDAIEGKVSSALTDADSALSLEPIYGRIQIVVSFLQSLVSNVPGCRGLDCYRAIMFAFQHRALAVRRVCGASKAQVDVIHGMMLGAPYDGGAAWEDIKGDGASGGDDGDGDGYGMALTDKTKLVSCMEVEEEPSSSRIRNSSADSGGDMSEREGTDQGGDDDVEGVVEEDEGEGAMEGDGDDIEDPPARNHVELWPENMDDGHSGADTCDTHHAGVEPADKSESSAGDDSMVHSRPMTKAVRQIVSCIAAAVVVQTALTMESISSITVFLQKYMSLSVNMDLSGAAFGILYGIDRCNLRKIGGDANDGEEALVMMVLHIALGAQLKQHNFIARCFSLHRSLASELHGQLPDDSVSTEIVDWMDCPGRARIDSPVVFSRYQTCLHLGWHTQSNSVSSGDRITAIINKWGGGMGNSAGNVMRRDSNRAKKCAYQSLAIQVAIHASLQGFWKVLKMSREPEGTRKLVSVFEDIGICDVDILMTDIENIDKSLRFAVQCCSEDNVTHYHPPLDGSPAISCLIGVRDLMTDSRISSGYPTDNVATGCGVMHSVIGSLQYYWREILSGPGGLDESTKAFTTAGDLLLGGLLDFAYASKRGFDNNNAKNTKQAMELAMNSCRKSLSELQLPLADMSGSAPIPRGMEEGARAELLGKCKYRRMEFAICSDVDQRTLVNAVMFLNYCMSVLPRAVDLKDGSAVNSLLTALSHLITTISLCMYKILVFLRTCSLRALLREIADFARDDSSRATPNMKTVCILAAKQLTLTPPPWMSGASYDVVVEIQAALASAFGFPKALHDTSDSYLMSKMLSSAHLKFPVVIINLDSRNDRWQNCLRECEQHGLLGVRLPAVDAKKSRYSRYQSTYSTQADSTAEDYDNVISPDLVTKSWDSTLNATFDKTTVVNKALAMTPSERACAMSHVLVWKLIFLSSLQGGDGSLKPLSRDCEARLAKSPPLSLACPRTQPPDSSVTSDASDIATFTRFRQWSQWADRLNGFYLVMEDDIEIKSAAGNDTKEFLVKVSELSRVLPIDTDICYLGYIVPKGAIAKYGKTYIKPRYLWQLHAYLLSPSGAKKLLSHLPINAPVDNFVATLIYENKLTACAIPMKSRLVKQAAGGFKTRKADSDIVHSGRMR